jgi:hypothetical protein
MSPLEQAVTDLAKRITHADCAAMELGALIDCATSAPKSAKSFVA